MTGSSAYVDFTKTALTGELPDFTCFAGTIIQEAYLTHGDVSAACESNISGHAKTLEADIRAAMRSYVVNGKWTAESLALHIMAVIQGGFILAKAKGGATVAARPWIACGAISSTCSSQSARPAIGPLTNTRRVRRVRRGRRRRGRWTIRGA